MQISLEHACGAVALFTKCIAIVMPCLLVIFCSKHARDVVKIEKIKAQQKHLPEATHFYSFSKPN